MITIEEHRKHWANVAKEMDGIKNHSSFKFGKIKQVIS